MNNPETHATLGTRQCFTKEALEKTKGTVKNEQWAQDYVLPNQECTETQATLGTRQCFTIQEATLEKTRERDIQA